MADKLSERLEAEAARTEPAWTKAPTMNPPTKPVHDARMQALLREAAELARRVEWRPIETAPTNEWVLVLDGIGDVCAAHQQFGYWYAWFDYVGEDLKLTEVTHWMPLPEPPEVG